MNMVMGKGLLAIVGLQGDDKGCYQGGNGSKYTSMCIASIVLR